MAALALVLTLLAAAPAPEAAVVVVRRTAIQPSDGTALAQQISDHLSALNGTVIMPAAEAVRTLNMLGVRDSADCVGRKPCTLALGGNLKVQAVIGITVSELEGEQAVELEAFAIPSGTLIARESLFLSRKTPLTAALLQSFAKSFKAGFVPMTPPTPPPAVVVAPTPPAPVVKDAPVVVPEPALVPPPAMPISPLVDQGPPEKSHVPALVVGGVGAAALVGSAVLLIVALNERAGLTANGPPTSGGKQSTLTYNEALALRDASNTHFTVAGILGAAGVGLGTTAVILW